MFAVKFITNMKMRHILVTILAFICSLGCAQEVLADTVPLDGNWNGDDVRSLSATPFFVKKEGNTLYVYSCMRVENVIVRIVSSSGTVFLEETSAFYPSDCMSLSLDGLEEGEYRIELSHTHGSLIGFFEIDLL